MKESIYKTYEELPLFLNAGTVAKVLGIAPSSTYKLMHKGDFPVRCGKSRRYRVSKFQKNYFPTPN